jgi:hypothetical protein
MREFRPALVSAEPCQPAHRRFSPVSGRLGPGYQFPLGLVCQLPNTERGESLLFVYWLCPTCPPRVQFRANLFTEASGVFHPLGDHAQG